MATSGVQTQFGFDDLLTEAIERCNIRADEINADHIISGTRSANLMLQSFAAGSFKQYTMQLYQPTLTPGQAALSLANGFTFPTGTLQIFSSVIGIPNALPGQQTYWVPMVRIARYDYEEIPNKLNSNRPDRYFWDTAGDLVSSRYMQLWPVPDQAYSLRVWCIVRSQDIGSIANSPDIGYEWQDAFAAELACRLARKFNPQLVAELRVEADTAYTVAERAGRERGPLRLRVDPRTRETSR